MSAEPIRWDLHSRLSFSHPGGPVLTVLLEGVMAVTQEEAEEKASSVFYGLFRSRMAPLWSANEVPAGRCRRQACERAVELMRRIQDAVVERELERVDDDLDELRGLVERMLALEVVAPEDEAREAAEAES